MHNLIFYTNLFHRVRAYGPGIEPSGPIVGVPANFTVETFSAGKGNVDVIVEGPGRKQNTCKFVISIHSGAHILTNVPAYTYVHVGRK